MPDVYAEGDFDLAGFAVGVVPLKRAIDPMRVEEGDVLIGLTSSGVHSNGFSLINRIVAERELDLDAVYPNLGPATLGEVLLTPTRIYAKPIVTLLRRYKVKRIVSGMAHITGGGLPGNLPRILHDGLDAKVDTSTWKVPPIFDFLQTHGNVDADEMARVFNMGVGFVLVVRPAFAESVVRQLKRLGEKALVMGGVTMGKGRVHLR